MPAFAERYDVLVAGGGIAGTAAACAAADAGARVLLVERSVARGFLGKGRAGERLDQPLTVEDLTRQARMSSRHLGRHFRAVTGTTPLQWLLTQRIRRAQELLETTDDVVDTTAAATGMGTATTLRRHFNRTVGVPPDTYRRTFRSRPRTGPNEARNTNDPEREGAGSTQLPAKIRRSSVPLTRQVQPMSRTVIDLDDQLVANVAKALGTSTKQETVSTALERENGAPKRGGHSAGLGFMVRARRNGQARVAWNRRGSG
jgi:AraC-like DNA-binding protein/Arc/MetJ family transcription regulator